MNCAWEELLGILPPWIRSEVNTNDRKTLQELRLRIKEQPEWIGSGGFRRGRNVVTIADLQFCINAASKYSPWAAVTAEKGYITAPGGHRIGLCGQTVCDPSGKLRIQELTSLCIRVARDFPGIARNAASLSGSILILGAPGWGKTTLLRDLCRLISEGHTLCVADERCELFPAGRPRGPRMDVLSGCPKSMAIEILLRTMGPAYIAADEITAPEDCEAMMKASNCGVNLIATAHASSLRDYRTRSVYQPLVNSNLFSTILLLRKDKSYTVERMIQ